MTATQIPQRGRRFVHTLITAGLLVAAASVIAIRNLGSAAASSFTLTFLPTDDAYGAEGTPATNFRVQSGPRRRPAEPKCQEVLRFGVSGIPAEATISKATLRVTATNSTSTPIKARPVSLSPAWSESTLTWPNRPAYSSSTNIPSSPTKVVAGPVSFDATALVAGNGPLGLGLLQGGTVGVDQLFSSKEGSAPPQLEIIYAPLPSPTPSASFPSADPTDPEVLAAGDIACDSSDPRYNGGLGTSAVCQQQATSDVVANEIAATSAPVTVLALSDNQYDCGALSDFQQAYDSTWGRFKSITAPVPGNHEDKAGNPNAFGENECTKGGSGYYNYFGSLAQDLSTGYYYFDVGSWHLIALNSNTACTKISCAQGAVQEKWLREDLAANTKPCKLAFWHEPAFSSKSDSASALAFWQDLYAACADRVVNGHIHGYERFALLDPAGNRDPNGIREIVAGTAGEDHVSFGSTTRVGSAAQNANTFGMLKLILHPTGYEFSFIPVTGQTYADSGSALCNAK